MKLIGAVLITVLTSLFYFPFNCVWLPSVNTKLALSIIGLVMFGYDSTKRQDATIEKTFASVSIWALLVSFVGLASVLINDTGDYTFASYIISVWVWMSAAYVVIKSIKECYGKISLRLTGNFLIAVCVIQCVLSQLIEHNMALESWVRGFVVSKGFMGIPDNRLFGIGCALDVAGLKFSVVLILLAYLAVNPSGKINRYMEAFLYFLAFLVITVLGSMISRTTTIGSGFALLLWIIYPVFSKNQYRPRKSDYRYLLIAVTVSMLVLLPIVIRLYNTNETFYENFRFGFEGFFSLFEKGHWEVRSNDMMMSMWYWPDNLKTWIIGDGYFNTPYDNPFYMGPFFGEYYMGTDVGYCRYVFYFGVLGLAAIGCFFINAAVQCSKNMPNAMIVFWLIFAFNLIGWAKVSSDIFPVFALLLLIGKDCGNKLASNAVIPN